MWVLCAAKAETGGGLVFRAEVVFSQPKLTWRDWRC